MQHINDKPINITANGATSVSASIPEVYRTKNGIEVFNPDTAQVCFIRAGVGAQVAVATDNFVPPNSRKIFRINPNSDTIAIVFPGASTVVVRCSPVGAFDEKGF